MSEAKHTPGPWPITWGHVIDIGGIAKVPQVLDGRHTANAYLISEAPGMLEALQRLVDQAAWLRPKNMPPTAAERNAADVIAKATQP